MELKNFFSQDHEGNITPDATCYLYQRGSENLVAGLQSVNGQPLSNPFTSDANGLVQLAAPNGLYDVRVVTRNRDYRLHIQFNDVNETVDAAVAAASRAEQARDAAQLWSGISANTAEGLNKTPLNGYFSVPSLESTEYLILYQNVANVAIEVKRYPSSEAVNRALTGAIRSYATLALMQADTSQEEGTSAVVTHDPDEAKNGWYLFSKLDGIWNRSANQTASAARVEAIEKQISTRKRPRSKSGKAPFVMTVGDKVLPFATAQKLPRSKLISAPGAVMMLGDTPVPPVIVRKRPRGPGGYGDVVIVSNRSVLMSSAGGLNKQTDARLAALEEQVAQTKPLQYLPSPPTWLANVTTVNSKSQIMVHDGATYRQATSADANWFAPQVGPFNFISCLSDKSGSVERYTLMPSGFKVKNMAVVLHKIITGQSLGLGSRGYILRANGRYEFTPGVFGDLFTEATPVGFEQTCFSLAGGPRPAGWETATDYVPLHEYASGVSGETIASSYATKLRTWLGQYTAIDPKILVSVSALGGVPYASLKKGTTVYQNALSQATAAKAIAVSKGLQYIIPSISIIHGESQINTTQAQYVAILAEWVSDYRTDLVAISGQEVAPIAFVSQMLTGETGTIPAIPLAQLQAHEENPNVSLIGPKYAYPYFDTYHMLAEGYVKIAEIEGRAEHFWLAGKKWQPLKPVSVAVAGNRLTVKFNNLPDGGAEYAGPIGRLAFDTNKITNPGNFGFELTGATITSVVLGADGASVVITTASALVGGEVLTYALQSAMSQPQNGNGRRGNLRDTDRRDRSRFDYQYLFNWSVAFSKTISL